MWGAAGGGLLVGLLGRAAGEGLSGGAVGHYAFVSAFAEKPQCSAHTRRSEECLQFPGSRKALGNSGSRLEAQKRTGHTGNTANSTGLQKAIPQEEGEPQGQA